MAVIGWSGVDLFFVLSGFLITGILIDARGSDRYFTSFYARRTLRIFPLYYLVVFISLIVLPRLPFWHDLLVGPAAPREQLPYWLYLTNFAVAARDAFLHGTLDVAWSLAIEEQFYLIWAAVVWLCPPRWLGPLCAAIVIGSPIARAVMLSQGSEAIDVYVLTPLRADALATGALLAWMLRHGWLERLGRAAPIWTLATLGGVMVVTWIDGDSWWWGPWMQRAGYSLLALSGAGMLTCALANADGLWTRLLSAGWLRAFGKYSYCLYLIHLPVMRTVRAFVLAPADFPTLGGSPWPGQLLFYAAATLPAFGLAWLSWHLFEAPILKLKSRFPY